MASVTVSSVSVRAPVAAPSKRVRAARGTASKARAGRVVMAISVSSDVEVGMLRAELKSAKAAVQYSENPAALQARVAELEAILSGNAPAPSYSAPAAPSYSAPAPSYSTPSSTAGMSEMEIGMLKAELKSAKAQAGVAENPAAAQQKVRELEALLSGAPAPAASYSAPAAPSYSAPAASSTPSSTAGMSEMEIGMLRAELKSAKAQAGVSENPAAAQQKVRELEALLGGGSAPASYSAPAPSYSAPAAPSYPSSTAGMSENDIGMLKAELKAAKAQASVAENPAAAQARVAQLVALLGN